ncbi:MAG: hypothetical protein K2G62_01410 [Oscillospiraceae bacterium]|nr:hypothetical protein [Oscillospiraceae bacterium]
MKKFIPYEKLSKKEKKRLDLLKRKDWGNVNPVNKVMPDKKKYNRKEKHYLDFTE